MRDSGNTRDTGGIVLTALLLAAGLLVVFRNELFAGADLFFQICRDPNPIFGFYPWSRFSLLCWKAGLFPLWNPYSLLGTPFLAHYQTSVFSVLSFPLLIGSFEKTVVPYLLARLLAAGLGAYLVSRRFGTSRSGGIMAGICFGLTGYLIQYVNDIHVVIDLLIPFLLLFGDRLVHERTVPDFLLTVLVTVLILLGGQPSAAFFTMALGYGYMAFMCVFSRGRLTGLVPIAGAVVLSSIISLPQLLPFLEYLPRAWTFHGEGFGKASLSVPGMLTWIAPGFLGPLSTAIHEVPHIRIAPYLGAVPAALALCILLKPRSRQEIFLCIVVLLCAGILSGAPPLSLVAAIPGLDRLTFIKYLQPLLAFSVAVLAGKGLDRATGGETRVLFFASFGLVAVIGLGWYFLGPFYPAFSSFMAGASLMVLSLMAVLVICFLTNAQLLKHKRQTRRRRLAAVFCAIALAWIELITASAVNHAHMFRDLSEHNFEKYKEIARHAPLGRMSVRPELFYANAGLVAPVFDLGISDVLFIKESQKLFMAAAGYDREAFRREFMRYHSFQLPFRPDRPGLARLMGVRYRLSRSTMPPNKSRSRILKTATVEAPSPAHFGGGAVSLSGDYRPSIFLHPPSRLSMPPPAKENAPSWRFKTLAGPDPQVSELAGDGAWFAATSFDEKTSLVFARYLDPRQKKSAQSWKSFQTMLSHSAHLSLLTLPGESDLNDWAYFGDPRIGSDRLVPPDRLYKGIKVYEDKSAYPRAYLAERLEWVDSEERVIETLDRAGYGRKPAVLVDDPVLREKLEPSEQGMVRVESYGLQRVKCRAYAEVPSLLVLADAYYPGWRAFIDGRETRILRTNLGLRGVTLPRGRSTIEFIYRPVSFGTGLWAALAALAALAVMVPAFWSRKNK